MVTMSPELQQKIDKLIKNLNCMCIETINGDTYKKEYTEPKYKILEKPVFKKSTFWQRIKNLWALSEHIIINDKKIIIHSNKELIIEINNSITIHSDEKGVHINERFS